MDPKPLTYYKDLARKYRKDEPEDEGGTWIVVIACAFVAVCLLAIKLGR